MTQVVARRATKTTEVIVSLDRTSNWFQFMFSGLRLFVIFAFYIQYGGGWRCAFMPKTFDKRGQHEFSAAGGKCKARARIGNISIFTTSSFSFYFNDIAMHYSQKNIVAQCNRKKTLCMIERFPQSCYCINDWLLIFYLLRVLFGHEKRHCLA